MPHYPVTRYTNEQINDNRFKCKQCKGDLRHEGFLKLHKISSCNCRDREEKYKRTFFRLVEKAIGVS